MSENQKRLAGLTVEMNAYLTDVVEFKLFNYFLFRTYKTPNWEFHCKDILQNTRISTVTYKRNIKKWDFLEKHTDKFGNTYRSFNYDNFIIWINEKIQTVEKVSDEEIQGIKEAYDDCFLQELEEEQGIMVNGAGYHGDTHQGIMVIPTKVSRRYPAGYHGDTPIDSIKHISTNISTDINKDNIKLNPNLLNDKNLSNFSMEALIENMKQVNDIKLDGSFKSVASQPTGNRHS
jgi:hypothetical protein